MKEKIFAWFTRKTKINEADTKVNSTDRAGQETVDSVARAAITDIAVSVKSFGAKGNGTSDDTSAFKKAIAWCKANRANLFVPRGTYLITDTIIIDFSFFKLYGDSKETVTLSFKIGSNDIGIEFLNAQYTSLEDISLSNINLKQGYGIKIGRYVSSSVRNPITRSLFKNISVKNFNIGIEFNSGWIDEFRRIETSYNNIGLRLGNALVDSMAVNAISIYDICAESNSKYGVELFMFERLNFFGGSIEGNPTAIGVKIRKGSNISFFGTYFESLNKTIEAATESGEQVEGILMDGIKHTGNLFDFDKVDKLVIRNFSETPFGIFNISNNVKYREIQDGNKYEVTNMQIGFYSNSQNYYQSSSPIYSTKYKDAFRNDINSYYTDYDKQMLIYVFSGYSTLSDSQTYNGKIITSKYVTAVAGEFDFTGNLCNYLINKCKFFCVRQELMMPPNTNTLAFEKLFYYKDDQNTNQLLEIEGDTLDDMRSRNVAGKPTTLNFIFDMDKIKAKLGANNYSRIYKVGYVIRVVNYTDNNIQGSKMEFYSTQIYDTKYIIQAEDDNRHAENNKAYFTSDILRTNNILLQSPNGTVYSLSVSDTGVLTVTKP